uniref:t-SNARE coiled-coil homology domain-containing protein n=1 Tax=Stomoxys calcitrans TaxID=35570 RepID=A0A1I8NTZ3_STOCA
MSLEDPFFVVKDEVFKALNKTRGLYLRWRELGENCNSAEAEWTTNELRNSLRSIEWDLEDLEDTISIVEKNPSKFRIDNRELSSRRHFIDNTRDEVKQMKEKMSLNRSRDRDITAHQPLLDEHNQQQLQQHQHQQQQHEHNLENDRNSTNLNHSYLQHQVDCPSSHSLLNGVVSSGGGGSVASTLAGTMAAVRHSGAKYSKLENTIDSPGHYNSLDSPSHRFVGETVSVQQRMMQGQDEQLDMISDSVGTLKTVSRQIGVELDEQAVMLDDFGNEFETTDSKLDSTMKKMAKVLHMNNDKRQWMAILILSALLLLVILLFFIL